MKTLLLILTLALPCFAQSLFSNGTTVQSGSGMDQRSNAYEFKGPYVLQWGLRDLPPSKRENPYWKPTTTEKWKEKWVSISIHDAASGKRIEGDMRYGQTNHLSVPSGGKHYVVMSGPSDIAWVLQAKEGTVTVSDKGPRFESPQNGGPAGVKAPETFDTTKEAQKRAGEAYQKWADALLASVKAEPEGPRREAAAARALEQIEAMNKRLGIKPDPEAKPSSVPGLPPGVEPTKKTATDLPPGMERVGK